MCNRPNFKKFQLSRNRCSVSTLGHQGKKGPGAAPLRQIGIAFTAERVGD